MRYPKATKSNVLIIYIELFGKILTKNSGSLKHYASATINRLVAQTHFYRVYRKVYSHQYNDEC